MVSFTPIMKVEILLMKTKRNINITLQNGYEHVTLGKNLGVFW